MIDKLYGDPEQLRLALPDCYYMPDCNEELIIEPENNKYLAHYSDEDVVSAEINDSLWEFVTDPVKFINSMRDATPEEIESIDKHIKERSYPTGSCFWDNWHLNQNNETGINEIDTYISEINSQDNFIAEVNSLLMPESYPHEDDNFYILENYRNMTVEELRAEKEKLLKEFNKEKTDEKNCKI